MEAGGGRGETGREEPQDPQQGQMLGKAHRDTIWKVDPKSSFEITPN